VPIAIHASPTSRLHSMKENDESKLFQVTKSNFRRSPQAASTTVL